MNQIAQPTCPNCNTHSDVIPFYYGLPSLPVILDAKAGKIALGNAALWPERPSHTCKTCATEFNHLGKTGEWKDPFVMTTEKQVAA